MKRALSLRTISFLVLSAVPFVVHADSFETTAPNPLPFTSIPGFICRGAYVLFWVALPLAVLAILIAAILYVVSGGNEQRIQRAKEALTVAVIGWVMVLISGGIALAIAQFLGGNPGGFGRC